MSSPPTAALATTESGPVVLFDGVCNLCHATVLYIVDRDPAGRFRFASLQSEVGRALAERHGVAIDPAEPDSIVLVEDGRAYERSTAALRIARKLTGPIRFLAVFLALPRFLRDTVYGFIARNRYRWFGRTESCRIPTPELRARFLDA